MMSVPYGYVTVSGGYSYSDYNSTIVTAAGTSLGMSGDNRSLYGTVDYVAWRTQDSKLNLSATVTGKRGRNYIGGTILDVNSRNLTVMDVCYEEMLVPPVSCVVDCDGIDGALYGAGAG